jgi:hypothetical protein
MLNFEDLKKIVSKAEFYLLAFFMGVIDLKKLNSVFAEIEPTFHERCGKSPVEVLKLQQEEVETQMRDISVLIAAHAGTNLTGEGPSLLELVVSVPWVQEAQVDRYKFIGTWWFQELLTSATKATGGLDMLSQDVVLKFQEKLVGFSPAIKFMTGCALRSVMIDKKPVQDTDLFRYLEREKGRKKGRKKGRRLRNIRLIEKLVRKLEN